MIPAHALVLAAGLGTRLRPLTLVRAKPAVPVAGEALVRRIVAWLAGEGVSNVTLNLHYLPETIAACLGDGSDLGVSVRYSWEQPVVLGSAGGPRLALDIVGEGTFWIVNGDTLTDVPLATMHEQHVRTGAAVTLALVPNVEPDRYGGVRLAGDGRVIGFVRKGPDAAGSFHFVGVQLVQRNVFETLRPGVAASTIGGIYDQLVASSPAAVFGYVSGSGFWDIGTVEDYCRTTREWLPPTSNSVGRRVSIDPSARISTSILWDDVRVGPGAVVTNCLLTDGVSIEDGATYDHTIFWRGPDGVLQRTALPHQEP